MPKITRVACLYRVSTKKQVEENDIPMQKNVCVAFIATMPGWVLSKEYYEKGVSGYHKSAQQRDILQQVRADAESGRFDVLLVFMFDRLGRREDETPFIVEWFVAQGIEVWSVKEGQQKFDNRADKLINYIRFWQSGGESEKTSMRVKEKHKQMVEDGQYRGGDPPYGYKLVDSDRKNQKGYRLKALAIDEDESEVVKLIFKLASEKGYGGLMIAKHLNEREIKTKKGYYWTCDKVLCLLKNPIYKGYYVSGKTQSFRGESRRAAPENWIYSNKQLPHLTIVDERTWNVAEEIRESRRTGTGKYSLQTKGPLLFVGLAKCGSCGANLGSRYAVKKWSRKTDNIEMRYLQPQYLCYGRRASILCTGQQSYSQRKIDPIIMEEVYTYMDTLKTPDLSSKIEAVKNKIEKNIERMIQNIKTQITKAEKEQQVLNDEITKALMGDSNFTSEQLSIIIYKKECELEELKHSEKKLAADLAAKLKEASPFVAELRAMIPNWREVFKASEPATQKMLLAKIIDSVVISKDSIDVHFKFDPSCMGEQSGYRREQFPKETASAVKRTTGPFGLVEGDRVDKASCSCEANV